MIYGPVDQPRELVTRDELSEEAGCLLCQFLQVMQHPQTATEAQHIEMLARGNAKIEGKTFSGEADTITYDGSKTQYVLIGDSSGPARLWRQLKVGAAPGRDSAIRIHFNPITHKVTEDGTRELDMAAVKRGGRQFDGTSLLSPEPHSWAVISMVVCVSGL